MIHSIYLMHNSGICLSSRTYSNNSLDVDLFSGFIAAMATFIKEIAKDTLTEIRMEQNHIYYEAQGSILLSIVASGDIDKTKLANVFQEILNEFFQNYSQHIDHYILSRHQFTDFAKKIDQILYQSGFLEKKSRKKTGKRRRKRKKRN